MLLYQLAAGRGPTGWLGTSWWGCVPDWSLRGRSWHGWHVLLLPELPREPINNEAHDWCLSLLLTTSASTCLTNSPNLGHTFQPSPTRIVTKWGNCEFDKRQIFPDVLFRLFVYCLLTNTQLPHRVSLQGWAKKWAPGCENVSGKLRQRW